MSLRFVSRTTAFVFPRTVTPEQALALYRSGFIDDAVLLMAKDWRTNTEPGEEDWFEELTPDELDDEDFLTDFAAATLQLWPR